MEFQTDLPGWLNRYSCPAFTVKENKVKKNLILDSNGAAPCKHCLKSKKKNISL